MNENADGNRDFGRRIQNGGFQKRNSFGEGLACGVDEYVTTKTIKNANGLSWWAEMHKKVRILKRKRISLDRWNSIYEN